MRTMYYETDSFLHRLDPLTKVIATAPLYLFLSLVTDPWTPAAFILLCLALILILGKIPLLGFLRTAVPLLLLVTGYLIIYPIAVRDELVVNSPVLFHLGPLVIYQAGVIFGLSVALRILAMIMLSLIFVLTTDAHDFVRALIQQWHLNYRLGYGVMAAYRFVPMLDTELSIIRAAHKIRGVSDRGGIRAQYERLRRYAIPLLASAIRRAERVALAMDARAFGAFPTRTYYKRFRFTSRDWLFIAVFWLISLGMIVALRAAGLMGHLTLAQ